MAARDCIVGLSEWGDVVTDPSLDSDDSWERFMANHKEWDVVCGITTRVDWRDRYDTTAYVDVGSVKGTIDAQDVNWGRCAAMPGVGQKVYCPILRFDTETTTVILGGAIRGWEEWQGVEKRFPVGTRHRGRVVGMIDDGAIVGLEPWIHGLIERSELQRDEKTGQPSERFSEGQEIEVVVLSIPQYPAQLWLQLGLPNQ